MSEKKNTLKFFSETKGDLFDPPPSSTRLVPIGLTAIFYKKNLVDVVTAAATAAAAWENMQLGCGKQNTDWGQPGSDWERTHCQCCQMGIHILT